MVNPFLYDGALRRNASINRVTLRKLPLKGIEDGIEGKDVQDVFSTRLVIEAIKDQAEALKLNLADLQEEELPVYLGKCLESIDVKVRTTAERIIEAFGKRLGLISKR